MNQKMKHIWRRAVALVFVLTSVLAMSAPAFAAWRPVLPNGSYVLYSSSKHTGLNVQYKAGSGGKVVVDEINGETNEIWILENVGFGPEVTLRPYHNPKCYLSGEKGFDGDLIVRSGFPTQRKFLWKPISVGNGQYIFKNSETGYVIDCAYGHNEEIGNRYLTYESNGFVEAQYLYPVRISELTNSLTPGKRANNLKEAFYTMQLNGDRNKAVNIQYAAGVGGNAVVDPSDKQSNEVVRLVPRGNNLYSIHFAHRMDLCLAPADIFPDSRMQLRTFNSNDRDCLWEIYYSGSGYAFRNAGTLLMLDDYCYRTSVGTPIIAYSFTGSGQGPQIFHLREEKGYNASGLVSPVPAGCYFNRTTVDWDGRDIHHDINRMGNERGVNPDVPVFAVASGTIRYYQRYTGYGSNRKLTSYGNFAELISDDGQWRVIYAHLDRFENPAVQGKVEVFKTLRQSGKTDDLPLNKGGTHVTMGEKIAYIGTTGNSDGYHLHIEIYRNGKRVDPTTVITGLTRADKHLVTG